MKTLPGSVRRVAAIVIGLVFFSAGLLKLMDPVGARLVVSEYLKFFSLGFLNGLSSTIGVGLALLETITGLALVTGVYRKIASIVASAFLVVFTIITLILWIANPEMDCGCFGEAVHLTHLQSFLKNVILCVLAAIAFVPFRDFGTPRKKKYFTFWIVAATAVLILVHSAMTIPFTDFTPFSLSSRLAAAEEFNEEGEDRYIATFIYEKNGTEGTFTLDNLPDSTWTFVRTETTLRQDNMPEREYPELSFWDADGYYLDELAIDDLVIAVSAYNPSAVSSNGWKDIAVLVKEASDHGIRPLILVNSTIEELYASLIEKVNPIEYQVIMPVLYYADYKTLISLNRSNGGATLFNEGHLIQKWSVRTLPDNKDLEKISKHDSTDLMLSASTKGRLAFQASFLYSFAMMLLI